MFRHLFKLIAAKLLVPFLSFGQSAGNSEINFEKELPHVFGNRVQQYRLEPVVEGHIVFLGNSITEGGDWKTLLKDSTILNRGIGGDITYGVLKRLDEVTQRKPSKIFLLIGINDLMKDFPIEKILEHYQTIVHRIKMESSGSILYLQSILPVNPHFKKSPKDNQLPEKINFVNRRLIQLANEENVHFLDIRNIFTDHSGFLNKEITYDGLHLNEKGYHLWAAWLLKNKLIY